ncbi:MAG: hypothetical protein CMC15_17445 [Flavobacteriaceae bacterium]|nr:hypothetical protein [Flavobacteriaceae bacterium]
MPSENKKIAFADLDGFLKIAPILGICVLAYLQTMFPSKVEFEKLENHLIQMDKKLTEMAVVNKTITNNSSEIRNINDRVRQLEIQLAKHDNHDKP